jgi:hypothetical protein
MNARASGKVEIALAAAAVVLLGAGAHLLHGIHGLRQDTVRVERTIAAGIAALRETAARASDAQYEAAAVLAKDLDATHGETATAARAAQTETQRYAELLLRRTAREHRDQIERVDEELSRARAASHAVDQASRQLGDARSDLAATRGGAGAVETDLARVATDLEALRIAARSNRAQLAALRASAERRVFEFRVRKPAQPAEVAGIAILLRTADPKRNRYSVDLIADGLRTEQRDRTLQEPVRFYASRSRVPCELVVTEIGQDEVAGYVAVPAATELARGYSSGSAETRNLPGR